MSTFRTSRPRAFAWALSLVALTVTGCPKNQTTKGVTGYIQEYRGKGWIPLEAPDSRFVPGSIFVIKKGELPQWISSLESCGVPKSVLEPTTSNSGEITSTVANTYGASAVLKVRGVNAGPDFKKAQTATITQSDSGPSAIDLMKVLIWMTDPKNANSFAPTCRQFLSQENTFIARESYRIGGGTYTLKDETGAALNLGGLNLKIVEIGANADLKLTSDSKLQLVVPVFTAVRQAVYANNLLKPLGDTNAAIQYEDQKILDMYK